MKHLSELLGVDEDDGLGHRTSREHIHNELRLLFGLTAQLKLTDVVQLQKFLFHLNLLRLSHNLVNGFLRGLGVRCREQYVLNGLRQLADVLLNDVLDSGEILGLAEEHIGFINDQTLEGGQIEAFAATSQTSI